MHVIHIYHVINKKCLFVKVCDNRRQQETEEIRTGQPPSSEALAQQHASQDLIQHSGHTLVVGERGEVTHSIEKKKRHSIRGGSSTAAKLAQRLSPKTQRRKEMKNIACTEVC